MARVIVDMLRSFDPNEPLSGMFVQAALLRYANTVEPWASAVATSMVAEVDARDKATWKAVASKISKGLEIEISSASTGLIMQRRVREQVTLIKSLPQEAALKVQEIASKSLTSGVRADDLAKEIMKVGQMTLARARLIARTEVGRTATELTKARAEQAGSTGYVWRTAKDSDVRPSHRAMEGSFVKWDAPPRLDGMTGHAGALPNCRCYPEVVFG